MTLITFASGRIVHINESITEVLDTEIPGMLVGATRQDGALIVMGLAQVETIEEENRHG